MPEAFAHDWTEPDPALPGRLVAAASASLSLRQRSSFFVWTQTSLQPLLPHQLLVCALEQQGDWHADVFNSVPLSMGLSDRLLALRQPAWLQLFTQWRQTPLCLPCSELQGEMGRELQHSGFTQLMLHGVAAPGRAQRAEAWFLWGSTGAPYSTQQRQLAAWLMPHLHAAWRQVQAPTPAPLQQTDAPTGITAREQQILGLLCQGLSNQAIAQRLDLSALTVKNHVQKLLRKLRASNRAQAVAMAMAQRLVPISP